MKFRIHTCVKVELNFVCFGRINASLDFLNSNLGLGIQIQGFEVKIKINEILFNDQISTFKIESVLALETLIKAFKFEPFFLSTTSFSSLFFVSLTSRKTK